MTIGHGNAIIYSELHYLNQYQNFIVDLNIVYYIYIYISFYTFMSDAFQGACAMTRNSKADLAERKFYSAKDTFNFSSSVEPEKSCFQNDFNISRKAIAGRSELTFCDPSKFNSHNPISAE